MHIEADFQDRDTRLRAVCAQLVACKKERQQLRTWSDTTTQKQRLDLKALEQKLKDTESQSLEECQRQSADLALARKELEDVTSERDSEKQGKAAEVAAAKQEMEEVKEELRVVKEEGRGMVVRKAEELKQLEARLGSACQEAIRTLEVSKNDELDEARKDLAQTKQQCRDLTSESGEKLEKLKINLEDANQKISALELSRDQDALKAKADNDRASIKMRSLEQQLHAIDSANNRTLEVVRQETVDRQEELLQETTITPDVISKIERLLKEANENQRRVARTARPRMLEALDTAFQNNADRRRVDRMREAEKVEVEVTFCPKARSDSTITVDVPQPDKTTATPATSPKCEDPTNGKGSSDIAAHPIEQPQMELAPAATISTPTRPNTRFRIPPPTGPSASRRRSIEQETNNTPSKRQKTSRISTLESTAEPPSLSPYVEPRRQRYQGAAYWRNSQNSSRG